MDIAAGNPSISDEIHVALIAVNTWKYKIHL